jgi:hypothetical protein
MEAFILWLGLVVIWAGGAMFMLRNRADGHRDT